MVEQHILNFDLKAIADSGQCFRMAEVAPDRFELLAGNDMLSIEKVGESRYRFDCDAREYERVWKPYFDLDVDYASYIRSVPLEDAFLAEAVAFGKGLRILRQDPWEMLITFIISQRKNIPAIRGAVEALCLRYGQPIQREGARRFAFPTPEALARQSAQALKPCALGYR
nr:DNA glycosylase [Clostridia bacterium]